MNQYIFGKLFRMGLVFVFMIGINFLIPIPSVQAYTFVVTKTTDTNDGVCDSDCSLREAIIASNYEESDSTIALPGGIYTLSIAGTDENYGATGDLDIRNDISIQGEGDTTTIIDGGGLDRIFDIRTSDIYVSINDVTLRNGQGGQGGAINNLGHLTISRSILTNNLAGPISQGGAIMNQGLAALTIIESTIMNNQSADGGGIFNSAHISIISSTIQNNLTDSKGGGLNNRGGVATISNSTFSGNRADRGGGISSTSLQGLVTSQLYMSNSTISGNEASFGGGVDDWGDASLNNVTITNNTSSISRAGMGGGIYGSVNLKNSIIAGNKDLLGIDPDCYGSITSEGYNLIKDTTDCTIDGDLTGNLIGVSPILGVLSNNGGFTFTHPLIFGSPAINAGNPVVPGSEIHACEVTDQRGITRPYGTRCDMGAYEVDSLLFGIFLPALIK